MIICLIIGLYYSAKGNLITIKYIFSVTMKAVLVIICLIIGVSNSAEVNLISTKYIFSRTMKAVLVIICLNIGLFLLEEIAKYYRNESPILLRFI